MSSCKLCITLLLGEEQHVVHREAPALVLRDKVLHIA